MYAFTPASSLATYHLTSCMAVVLYCASMGRTAFSHSPNFPYRTTLALIFDRVSGEEGIMDKSTEIMRPNSRSRSPPSSRSERKVDIAVTHGFEYADPQKAARFGHDS
jgi:hypothetical protein